MRDLDLSCQEYVEGDCIPFFGINADGAVTQYALELVECTGDAPPNPQCRRSGLSATSWFDRASSAEKLEGGAAMLGLGMIFVAAAMSYRRHSRRTTVISDQLRASTPDEITPLVESAAEDWSMNGDGASRLSPDRATTRSPVSPMDYAYDGRFVESPSVLA